MSMDGGFAVVAEHRRTGKAQTASGETVPFNDVFTEDSGRILYDVIRKERPQYLLELGMAHGTSTLYMLQALADNGGGKLISCDPHQRACGGVGVQSVHRAGLEAYHEFLEVPSEIILPMLMMSIMKGERPPFDFVFIDTNHMFDQTIVELYYTDRILRRGGIVALDDCLHSAVFSATRFWEANRHYFEHSIHRENRKDLDNLNVFEKVKDDDRQWFHFVPFEISLRPYKGSGVRG